MLEAKLSITIEPPVSKISLGLSDMFSSKTGNSVTLNATAYDSSGNELPNAKISVSYKAYAILVQGNPIKTGSAGSGLTGSNGTASIKFTTPTYSSQTAQPIVTEYVATCNGVTSNTVYSYSGFSMNMYASNSNGASNDFESGSQFTVYVQLSGNGTALSTSYGPSGIYSSIKIKLTDTTTGTTYTSNLSSKNSTPATTAQFNVTINNSGTYNFVAETVNDTD